MVKLAKDERGSAAMWCFIGGARLVGSELLLAEVPRALRAAPLRDPAFDLTNRLRRAEILLGMTTLRPVRRLGLFRAGRIFEPGLRSLDAIHTVTALELRPILAFVTYDERQAAAAREVGLRVVSPGMRR